VATAHVLTRPGRYLTFLLSRRYFAIRSDSVRHIVPASDIRVITGGPAYLCGSVGANGRLVAVLDLREQLGLGPRPLRSTACVVVVGLSAACPVSAVGIVADKLSEVVEFRPGEIRGSKAQQRIQGRPYGRPKTLLDPEELLSASQWSELRSRIL